MPHILKNDTLEIKIDLPLEAYSRPRFDWTGKIASVTYKGIALSSRELPTSADETLYGKGMCNEFDIQTALGYDAVEVGGWFHKIGVGLLRKEEGPYNFFHPYAVRPAEFAVETASDQITLTCRSLYLHGYAYVLEKEILLQESGFSVRYALKNVGEKPIHTQEYNHNFLAIGDALMGPDYTLRFPFDLQPTRFDEIRNPNQVVQIGAQTFSFQSPPQKDFFFSNLSGSESVPAHWALENQQHKIGLSETGNFQTDSINLWGRGHVVSPELFVKINVAPGATETWERQYKVYELG